MSIKKFFDFFIDIVYPPTCLICKDIFVSYDGHKYICNNCKKVLLQSINIQNRCKICSKTLINNSCNFCNSNETYKNISLFDYDGYMRSLLYNMKYSNNKKLAKEIILLYKDYLIKNLDYFNNFDYIVSVPLHKKKLRQRGFNQSEVMAQAISEIINIPYYPLLIRTKHTPPQSKLNFKQRRKNLEGVFEVNKYFNNICINGKKVIIIDDIFTSGTTILYCGKTLENAGVSDILSITITTTKNNSDFLK